MNKFLKYGLWATGGAAVLAASGAAYVAATFNPNDYKPQIIQAVKDKQQRTLKLDGDIKLTFFPVIGANLGKASLSEHNSEQEFAAIESAHVALALWPLISRHLVVDEVAVSGLKATLMKFKNGKSNIDDLLGKDEVAPHGAAATAPVAAPEKQPVMFDIASVRVDKAELNYRDEKTGAEYALKDLNLKTGRIANGVPVKLAFAAQVQSKQPKLDIATQLKTTLTFDLDKRLYQVQGLDLQAKGAALDLGNLVVQASGDAGVNLVTQEFSAKKLMLSATGVKGADNFEAKLDAPALNLTKDKFSGDTVTANAKLDGASGNIAAKLTLPGLEGTAQFFKSSALVLEVDVKQAQQSFNVQLSSPVAGSFEGKQFNLADLKMAVHASGDKLPNKSLSSELKGSVQVDVTRESVQASLAGGLLQSQLKAKVAMNNFDNPAIRFDVDVDQFDADLYVPEKARQAGAAKSAQGGDKPAQVVAEQPLDLSALKKLNLEGSLRVGMLKVANVKFSQLRVDTKAHNGTLNFSPLSANLYQGNMSGSVTVNTAPAVSVFSVNEKLVGINIGPLLKDAADFDTLEGKGNVTLDLRTQGNAVGALKKALSGNLALSLADGAVKGINVAKKLRDAGNLLNKQAQTQAANKEEKTDFSEMKASFKINNGVAHNDDLSLKSPLLRLSGNGDIDLGNDRINYLAKATLVATLQGQGGKDVASGITVPVRLSGPFADLKYTLDFGAMVSGAAKQKIEAKKEEVKTQLKDKLKEGLKGLFK